MKENSIKKFFYIMGVLGCLTLFLPLIVDEMRLPNKNQFSELYLLDPQHKTDNFPYNVKEGQIYTLFVCVGNQRTKSAYYQIYVKFCNQTDQLPIEGNKICSPLLPLYECRFILGSQQRADFPIEFKVSNLIQSNNQLTVEFLNINSGVTVSKPATWDSTNPGFHYSLLFELWEFDSMQRSMEYTGQFVNLQLNCTH
jgi:uncharacterized membrane protein